MADEQGRIDWRKQDVVLKVSKATDELLTQLAFQGEALAKVNVVGNDQVDTGFMLNSIYGIGPNGDHYDQTDESGTYLSEMGGQMVERVRADKINLQPHEAAIAAAASYAVYQEMKQSFLYRALEELAGDLGAAVEIAAREMDGD